MGKITEWEKEKWKREFKEITAHLIPKIDDIMGRNQDVKSWEELSEEDSSTIDSMIIGGYFNHYDFQKAIKDGLIDKELATKILAFLDWYESLGGWET